MQRFSKTISTSPNLYEKPREIKVFRWTFEVKEKSIFKASGHIGIHHRGLYGTNDKAILVALKMKMDRKWIKGSKINCNIVGTEQHYAILPVFADMVLKPGKHTVSLWMRSASSAAKGKNGLAEIKGTFNHVVYEVESV